MMQIFLDSEYKCYLVNSDGLRPVIVNGYFDEKCPACIEGYRFVPEGETWIQEDGMIFQGEMVAPWKPWEELTNAQRAYERQQLEEANAQNAQMLETIAVIVDEVYQSDIETLGI